MYNAAYANLLGAGHLAKWGLPLPVFFADNWHIIDPLISDALESRGSYKEDLRLVDKTDNHKDEQRLVHVLV